MKNGFLGEKDVWEPTFIEKAYFKKVRLVDCHL